MNDDGWPDLPLLDGGFLMDLSLFVQLVLFGLCCAVGSWAVR